MAMTLEEVQQYLRSAPKNFASRDSSQVENSLAELKKSALANADQVSAKDLWCMEQILKAQDAYIAAFADMKSGHYYDAWCLLETSEIALYFLSAHFQEIDNEYHLAFIDRCVVHYQSIFPYNVFGSIETIVKKKSCTICGKEVSIRKPCGHVPGEIYDGEMCCRSIDEFQGVGMAFVDSPVNKYSVFFEQDESGERQDQYDYRVVKYVVDRLQSPFHEWHYEKTTIRRPHAKWKHVGRNEKCPCESGKKYKKCCLLESGVLRPHLGFHFAEPIPEHRAETVYPY